MYKKIIAFVVALAAILSLAACSSTDSTDDTKTNDSSKKTSFTVGESYTEDGRTITLTSVNTNFTEYSEYAKEEIPEGSKVIQATFDFANDGDSDFLADAYSFSCFADNESCNSFYYTDDSGFSDTLSSGKKATGRNVYFVVPESAQSIVLEYETDWLTSTRIEFVVQ